MRKKLLARLRYMNGELDNLFIKLAPYSYEQLNKKPAPDSWSAAQVMHHLMVAEKGTILYCQKKLSFKPSLPKAGLKAKFRLAIINFYLVSPIKVKAPPSVEAEQLPEEDSLENIMEQWKKQREEYADFLRDLPEEYLDKEVFKHPLGGRLSFLGMLSFTGTHFRWHQKQLFRALNG